MFEMPVQATTWAERVDWINDLITFLSILFTVLITGAMIYFAVRYRRKSEDQKTAYITHSTALETLWTAIPTVVTMALFFYGFFLYREMRNPPINPLEITVDAYRWAWEFEYPNGKRTNGELTVPLGKPVRLIMQSRDVIHSFYIPAMRIKEDILNGYYTYLWFTPTKLGTFPVFCAEYCGTRHSDMQASLKVVTPEEYADFNDERAAGSDDDLTPAQRGEKLFKTKGCVGCHSLGTEKLVGPGLKGLFGRSRECTDGTTVTADENYLKESIMNPTAKIASGFSPLMPPMVVTDEEVRDLIAFIKEQK